MMWAVAMGVLLLLPGCEVDRAVGEDSMYCLGSESDPTWCGFGCSINWDEGGWEHYDAPSPTCRAYSKHLEDNPEGCPAGQLPRATKVEDSEGETRVVFGCVPLGSP